jgi:prolyl 4-hydroxylase
MNIEPAHTQKHPMVAWAIENLGRGCEPNAIMKTMMESGVGWRDAHALMLAAEKHIAAPAHADRLPSPRRALFGSHGCPDGQMTRVALHVADPEVALLSNMFSPKEADELIELGRSRLTRSLTVDDGAAQAQQAHAHRSSDGASLWNLSSDVIATARARASWIFEWPEENFEGLQILRYLPGQEYRPHHDWFDPATPGGSSQLTFGGQRVATAVVYLNDCSQGGGTIIPALGVTCAPMRGNAIFFSYASDRSMAGDARLLHAGEPVEEGEKWVCTFWMRQKAFVTSR